MENLESNNNLEDTKEVSEAAELDDVDKKLKASVGGYTKKSVIQYLETIKKQHHSTENSLKLSVQTLFDEKEKLTEYCEKLKGKIDKHKNDNKVLADKVASQMVENMDSKIEDFSSYKSIIKALQHDVKELENKLFKSTMENKSLEDKLVEKEKEISQKDQSSQLLSEIIAETKKETEAEKEKSSELSVIVSQLKDEIVYFKEIVSAGKISELNIKIDELSAMVDVQNAIVEKRSQEIETKNITIETVTLQNDVLNKTITNLTENIDSLIVQNEKLSAVNKIITQKLEEVQKDIVDEISEKSDIYIEKLILARRLDEALLKLNVLDEKRAEAFKA